MANEDDDNSPGELEKLPDLEGEDGSVEPAEVIEPTYLSRVVTGDRRGTRHLWLISYSDFMTILMIFFLAMYGYTYMAKAALLKQQQEQLTYSEFTGRIQEIKDKLGDQVKVENELDKVVVQLGEKVLFGSGSATLAPGADTTLEELAKSIKLVDGDVIVEGHTDNVPIRAGRFKSNWELSAARAFSVIRELTAQGVPAERLAAWGFGENRPIADNLTPGTRAENRRIAVIVLKKKGKV